MPLKQPIERGVELFNANNKLLVFEWPEEGYDYGIGIDNSGGTKQDNSVIAVNRHSLRGNEPDKVVAMFVSNTINPANMHTYGMAIAALYKVDGLPKGRTAGGHRTGLRHGRCHADARCLAWAAQEDVSVLKAWTARTPKKTRSAPRNLAGTRTTGAGISCSQLYKNAVENH